jgi:hypothetical protein
MTMPSCPEEEVYHNTRDWPLVRDLHRGVDNRYLVVFKNQDLYSIRDLCSQHIDVLRDVVTYVKKWLPTQEPVHYKKYHMFFHYICQACSNCTFTCP